jgi:hypothetical protein
VTTLQVRRGFSGAPVVNHRGKVMGVMLRPTGSREQGDDLRSLFVAVEPRLAYRLLRRPKAPAPTAGLDAAIERARRAVCAVDVQSLWRRF